MFYDFTDVYQVNVNNALELANQSVHYISFKHKPYVINVCKWYSYDRELRCQNVSGTFILIVYYFPPYMYLAQKLTKS